MGSRYDRFRIKETKMISRRRDRVVFYCQICILLICVREIRSEGASVNKEDLREEHLLPVRITRDAKESAFEGSGDDNVAILPLRSRVMERLTLDDNKVDEGKDDSRSKETAEDFYEGSGDEETPAIAAVVAEKEDDARNVTAAAEDATTEESDESEEEASTESSQTTTVGSETETVKESSSDVTTATTADVNATTEAAPSDETTTIVTQPVVVPAEIDVDSSLEVTDVTTVQSETTVTIDTSVDSSLGDKEETESIATEEGTTTIGPDTTVHTEISEEIPTKTEMVTPDEETKTAATTESTAVGGAEDETGSTVKEEEVVTVAVGVEKEPEPEPEPITEVVEVKHVQEVFAVPEAPKEEEEEEEEPETTTAAATTTTTTAATTTTTTETVLPVAETENATLLENENLTAGMDTLHMKINSRLLDSSDTVVLTPKDPSRLGTYIVVSLILLSFLSLAGFILMKRRVQKRRKQSNIDQENLDTEKALLSLSEYKDHPDGVDEGKMRNNEITPLAIKSNTQINKFEKNTNFSSPKNLNTKANEKNMEKDNVLKKASDNLTQVIIEDPTKDADEDKNPASATEKLIVRTHIDQDSIPKKPVIVNGINLVPVTQD